MISTGLCDTTTTFDSRGKLGCMEYTLALYTDMGEQVDYLNLIDGMTDVEIGAWAIKQVTRHDREYTSAVSKTNLVLRHRTDGSW